MIVGGLLTVHCVTMHALPVSHARLSHACRNGINLLNSTHRRAHLINKDHDLLLLTRAFSLNSKKRTSKTARKKAPRVPQLQLCLGETTTKMSTNTTKMMLVNCSVQQNFNFVAPPNMNMPVMLANCSVQQGFNFVTAPYMKMPVKLVIMCWRCHFVQELTPGAKSKSISCGECGAITHVVGHDSPSALPSRSSPTKKAVICVSYKKSSHGLKDRINDANNLKSLLIDRFGFQKRSIFMLTCNENAPTKENLLKALCELVGGCQRGDSLFFYYSGPGSRQRDYRRGRKDGYNETLCPLDFEDEGMIYDDEINQYIVRPLPLDVKLHAIIDSFHSGSVLDLPFLCSMTRDGWGWTNHSPRSGAFKGTSGGDAISFSSTRVDVKTTADTSDQDSSKISTGGAITRSFIEAISNNCGDTYWSILHSMQTYIRKNGGTQKPLLSACGPLLNVTTPFKL